jgi:hypothetical protein
MTTMNDLFPRENTRRPCFDACQAEYMGYTVYNTGTAHKAEYSVWDSYRCCEKFASLEEAKKYAFRMSKLD